MTLFIGEELACRRGERLVFAGLSFALAAGGALLLAGPNGSGKSSLLRLISGLLPPAAGRLLWAGEDVAGDLAAHRARLQLIGHQDAVKPVLTVAEALSFSAGMRGGDRVDAALERFRLAALADWPCRFLSSGQRRRLALARLIASPAQLWLLDEPSVGLDQQSVRDLEAAIDEHRGAGGIVILSTHVPLAVAGAVTIELAEFAPREEAAW
jgi:heme exporter protein A